MSEPDPLQEAIKRAREIAAKMPSKQSVKRPASELDDVGVIKVTLAYDKVNQAKAARENQNLNDEHTSGHRSPSTHNHHSSSSSSNNNYHQSHHNRQQSQHYQSDSSNLGGGSGGPGGQQSIPLTGANAYPRGGEEKIEIIIPHTVIGLVIGKGGENIKRIQSETGATVRVDPNTVDEQGNKVCTITGTKQAVTEAHSQVTQVIENAATSKRPRLQNDGGEQFRMKIPASRTGAIIGKGGETIKQIKQQSGCDIELDKNSKDQEESVFIIRGTPDKITKARSLIEARLASRGRDNNDQSGRGGPGGGGGGSHKYHATGANATPVAPYTDLPTSYGAPVQQPTPEATAAWGAYFAQYSNLFNPSAPPGAPAGGPPTALGAAAAAGIPYGAMPGPSMMAGPVAPPDQSQEVQAPPTSSSNPTAPQAANQPQDYTDQWIEYYLAVGRPDYAEQTMQMKKLLT